MMNYLPVISPWNRHGGQRSGGSVIHFQGCLVLSTIDLDLFIKSTENSKGSYHDNVRKNKETKTVEKTICLFIQFMKWDPYVWHTYVCQIKFHVPFMNMYWL